MKMSYDIKDNPIFKKRNLDDEDIPETEAVKVESIVDDQQISLFDDVLKNSNVKSFQEIDTSKDIDKLYEEYQKAYVKKVVPKKKSSDADGQMNLFDYFKEDNASDNNDESKSSIPVQVKGHIDKTGKYFNQESIKYSVEIRDLQLYYDNYGCVYFQIFIDENNKEKYIYYNSLYPSILVKPGNQAVDNQIKAEAGQLLKKGNQDITFVSHDKGFEKYKDKKQNTKGGNHISVAKSIKEKSSKKKK